MTTSELDSRNIAISMRKSVENLVISSQDAIGQSISQALTFSGVITQHANQMIHENRSVSRSPSPSPRSLADNSSAEGDERASKELLAHKLEEWLLQGSDAPSADPVDPPLLKPDLPKVSSSARSIEGGAPPRAKKKSWYNSLYPTYKSKSDDFKRLFKDLPDDERLIVDYSCALQKDILAHGRLYASQNYLCFYASIFGWETSLVLRWKDVTAITKEKTALVIPNAILVCTEGEKNFLTSFSGRDKAYLMLFRIWQNALMDQPMTSQEIWQWVHSCYGEQLGFNSDDEGYARDHDEPATPQPPPDNISEELADTSSMEASGAGDGGKRRARDSSPPLVSNGDSEYKEEGGDTLPTDMSDTSESEPEKQLNAAEAEKCSAPHDGRVLLQQTLPFNIDTLFTMLFTNTKFNVELQAARGASDFVQAPWQPAGGEKCRQVSYTLALTAGFMGPKEVHVTETQVMRKCSKPGQLYAIDCTSENAGIPYAEHFCVQVHYCAARRSDHLTDLVIYGRIDYKKYIFATIKSFLEKNTMAGLEQFCSLLEARLAGEAEGEAPERRAGRRRRRPHHPSSPEPLPLTSAVSPLASTSPPRPGAPRAAVSAWLLALLAALLLINGLLYWRLYYADNTHAIDVDDLQNRMSSLSGSQMAEWSKLLEAHTQRQRGQLLAWRDALDRAVTHLAQTEQALTRLLETIKPSLEKAQREAESGVPPGPPPGGPGTPPGGPVTPPGGPATPPGQPDAPTSHAEL